MIPTGPVLVLFALSVAGRLKSSVDAEIRELESTDTVVEEAVNAFVGEVRGGSLRHADIRLGFYEGQELTGLLLAQKKVGNFAGTHEIVAFSVSSAGGYRQMREFAACLLAAAMSKQQESSSGQQQSHNPQGKGHAYKGFVAYVPHLLEPGHHAIYLQTYDHLLVDIGMYPVAVGIREREQVISTEDTEQLAFEALGRS